MPSLQVRRPAGLAVRQCTSTSRASPAASRLASGQLVAASHHCQRPASALARVYDRLPQKRRQSSDSSAAAAAAAAALATAGGDPCSSPSTEPSRAYRRNYCSSYSISSSSPLVSRFQPLVLLLHQSRRHGRWLYDKRQNSPPNLRSNQQTDRAPRRFRSHDSHPNQSRGQQNFLRSLIPTVMGSAAKLAHGHGCHGHSHRHDNAYLVSANTNDSGVRITRIGLFCNLSMAVAKFAGGWAFNSKSMTANAWHSIADLASDMLTLATVSWSLTPPSRRFPCGYGKIESLGSLGVSGMLLFGGAYMGWESALSLFAHFSPDLAHDLFGGHIGHGHGHGHGHSHGATPSIHAAWLATGTILVKEWLYHATMKVARERKSSVLSSNAMHHRVDSLTGVVTLVAILGANMLKNAAWLDPVGGLLISIMVVRVGVQNTAAALYELADQSINHDIEATVRKQAQQALAGLGAGETQAAELRNVSGIKSGQNYLVDVEVAVPRTWTMEHTAKVEHAVRAQVGAKVRGMCRLRVRFVLCDGHASDGFDEFIPGSPSAEAVPEPELEPQDRGKANSGK